LGHHAYAPWGLPRVWKIRRPDVGWDIATTPASGRDLTLLVAVNRAAAFGLAARWLLHDIRSPAQSLTLLADLVTDPDAELENILRESCSHIGRALELLTRVLNPPLPAAPGPISVREPLEFVGALHRAGRGPARLELVIDPAVQAAAGVERPLEHALLNLVLNSMEALRSRQDGLITITARSDGDTVVIAVADNGPGLPPEVAHRLFTTPLTTKPGQPLVGLGLLAANEVLRLSGGTLAYSPDSEPGARFVITLPRWVRPTVQPA
jgi:two-component system C4-dicarboxylate transport sensor histidine kinase DctB